ncbi:MAG: Bax inhibitor-1/YccA family protein [Saprospirales bacterium]|nr:MAG: Bax inhibitor-1/YccA family protein [Saprospirales bacterium]
MKSRTLFQSSNPVLSDSVFQREAAAETISERKTMTREGAINKSILLFLILLGSSGIGWIYANPVFLFGGMIVGLITVLIAVFKPKTSPIAAPIYALVKGLFVGTVSAMYASAFGGIIFHAVTLTFTILFVMLFIYKTGVIKVTSKFRTGVVMATFSVFIIYAISWVLLLFGIQVPMIHEGGWMAIGFSLVVIGIASMNLLLDFDNFDKGAEQGAPAYMEWFVSMGLLITLVWLYIEILRLLAILQGRD